MTNYDDEMLTPRQRLKRIRAANEAAARRDAFSAELEAQERRDTATLAERAAAGDMQAAYLLFLATPMTTKERAYRAEQSRDERIARGSNE